MNTNLTPNQRLVLFRACAAEYFDARYRLGKGGAMPSELALAASPTTKVKNSGDTIASLVKLGLVKWDNGIRCTDEGRALVSQLLGVEIPSP